MLKKIDSPMISVIIPTHNRAHLIVRSIQSVITQNYQNWELIIVDDGSTDESIKIIKPFLKDSRITYFWKKNSGAAHSRNEGVKIAQGKYVTFLDSDDEARVEWLQSYWEVIEKFNPEVICCGLSLHDKSGALIKEAFPNNTLIFYPEIKGKFTNSGTYLLLREKFLSIRGFDPELSSGQHTEFALRMVSSIKQNKILNIRKPLIKVHIHPGERIRTSHRAKYYGAKRMLALYKTKFDEYPDIKSTYQSIVAYNASKLGLKPEAIKFATAAFKTSPSLKKFLVMFKILFI